MEARGVGRKEFAPPDPKNKKQLPRARLQKRPELLVTCRGPCLPLTAEEPGQEAELRADM